MCCAALRWAQTGKNWRLKRFFDVAFYFDSAYINIKLTIATHLSALRVLTFHRAFDTVPQSRLCSKLFASGVHGYVFSIIKFLNAEATARICTAYGINHQFS